MWTIIFTAKCRMHFHKGIWRLSLPCIHSNGIATSCFVKWFLAFVKLFLACLMWKCICTGKVTLSQATSSLPTFSALHSAVHDRHPHSPYLMIKKLLAWPTARTRDLFYNIGAGLGYQKPRREHKHRPLQPPSPRCPLQLRRCRQERWWCSGIQTSGASF